ncbi:MAG TPA: c-type cytochrome [Arenimonas sp.]|jgi:cytochrome c553|nr:c-type cytochrome [Arenimonas sp.]
MRQSPLSIALFLPLLAACAEGSAGVAQAVGEAGPAAAGAERPARLGLCVACHGEDGISRIAGTPHLAGQDGLYLQRALQDYRSGRRQHVPMTGLANSLQPADIEALAAWYSSRPGFATGGAP